MATTPNQTLFPAFHPHPILTNPHPWLRECELSTVVMQMKIMSIQLTMNYQRNFIRWNTTYPQNLRHRTLWNAMRDSSGRYPIIYSSSSFSWSVESIKEESWRGKVLSFTFTFIQWIVPFFLYPAALSLLHTSLALALEITECTWTQGNREWRVSMALKIHHYN